MCAMIALQETKRLRPCGSPTRRTARANVRKRTQDFSGMLQADAYAGFDPLYESGRIQEAGCWAHVRRKFYDLHVAHNSPVAAEALRRIGELYAVEADIRGQQPDERRRVRGERSRPLLASLKQWLEETLAGKHSKKSETAQAVRYALGRWEALLRYANDGRLEIDNKAAERALRVVALGRNYAECRIMRSRVSNDLTLPPIGADLRNQGGLMDSA
jgi:transposase